MEQLGDGAGHGINACEVGALVKIAVDACEAEVGLVIGAAMLAWTDMLDVQGGQRRVILVQTAILTPKPGALPHEGFRRLSHDAALACIWRACRRRVATNLLAWT